MSWNYRLMARPFDNQKGFEIELYEVHYNKNNVPTSYSAKSVGFCVEVYTSTDSHLVSDIESMIQRLDEAYNKPILCYGKDFPSEFIQIK